MNSKLIEMIKEASNATFYQMEKHSQLVIDLVESIEMIDESDLEIPDVRGSLSYDIDNILEIIEPSRVDDIQLLNKIKSVLN
jgi:hypothetical protein